MVKTLLEDDPYLGAVYTDSMVRCRVLDARKLGVLTRQRNRPKVAFGTSPRLKIPTTQST